ncbi:MAG TPA: ElyC/SanA/YdcF family protein [Pseudolabrys sp.]|nr:ElyC/SanA/YdcF family protein [Pseudolabrys sp.]
MYFILSKTLAFFTLPSSLLIMLAIAGTVLLFTRFARIGRTFLVVSMLGFVVFGFSPVGKVGFWMLENRFPAWSATSGAPAGFIILGGSVDPAISAAHGEVALTDSVERLAVVPELIKRYPGTRIIFTGGNGTLFGGGSEAAYAEQLLARLGVASGRVEFEGRSRNTLENAAKSWRRLNPVNVGWWSRPRITCRARWPRFGAPISRSRRFRWTGNLPTAVNFIGRNPRSSRGWRLPTGPRASSLGLRSTG